MIVLSHGRYDHILPFLTEKVNAEHERVFAELQNGLVGLSPKGRQIIVPGSGHAIMTEQPDAVVQAIEQVIGEVREGQSRLAGTRLSGAVRTGGLQGKLFGTW